MIDLAAIIFLIIILVVLFYTAPVSIYMIGLFVVICLLCSSCLSSLTPNTNYTGYNVYTAAVPQMAVSTPYESTDYVPTKVRPDGYYDGNMAVINAMQEGYNGQKFAYGYYDGTNYVI